MLIVFSDQYDARTEAILLAAGPGCMRVVRRGQDDTVELRLSGGLWVSESGEAVEIEAVIPLIAPGDNDRLLAWPVLPAQAVAAAEYWLG